MSDLPNRIRVLVADDSLFMRTLVSDMLTTDPGIEVVGTAKNGEETLEKVAKLRPDCITLDLVMPGRWSGLTTLERIMSQCPTPVVLLSAYSRKGAHVTMQCLEAGAVGFVPKPSGELSLNISRVSEQLLREVKTAANAHVLQRGTCDSEHERRTVPSSDCGIPHSSGIIVVGASTGGPQTLKGILQSLPSNRRIPMLVVQHMPSLFFTTMLAEHLSKACGMAVAVAEDGQVLQDNGMYLAPAGYQTRLVGGETPTRTSLTESKLTALSPCIDITMKSAAEVFGTHAIGIILSGMGDDGCEGMKAIKQAGGKTLAEDASALIYGMPKEVIDAGLADKVVPAHAMAEAITEALS